MKQVFPGIRPRRLGTRGHSRYCYAAMRKATKLDPPCLPDLNTDVSNSNSNSEDDPWPIVKIWAEGMLKTSFASIQDLSVHIKNHLNVSVNGGNSRKIVPKKLLQKDIKDKKKMQIINRVCNSKTKRRKKKSFVQVANIKNEIEDELNSLIPINLTSASEAEPPVNHNQMNELNLYASKNILSNSHEGGTNLACDNMLAVDCIESAAAHQIKSEISSTITSENDRYVEETAKKPSIYCKKVKQAQQSKNWTGNINSPQYGFQSQPKGKHLSKGNEFAANQLSKRSQDKEVIFNIPHKKKIKYDMDTENVMMSSTLSSNTTNIDEPMNLNINSEKSELHSDFIIPRERVISICNLDKDALDDYLNGGDDSQEQEAELLQYFQTEKNNEQKTINNNNTDFDVQTQSAIPILESYQIYNDIVKTEPIEAETVEKISQLRSCLQQNLQNTIKNEQFKIANNQFQSQLLMVHNAQAQQMYAVMQGGCVGGSNQNPYPGSASASLALMSQRHNLNESATNLIVNRSTLNKGPKRKLNLNIDNANNAPTIARRRDLNFVPISPGPHSPHVSSINNNHIGLNNNNNNNHNSNINNNKLNSNTFLSPRAAAQTNTKKSLNRAMSMNNKLPLLNIPMQNATESIYEFENGRGFSKPKTVIKSEISASAPQSPVIQHARYSSNLNYQYQSGARQSTQCSPDLFPQIDPLESRSQSVPLHCRSPSCNNIYNYSQGYASTCNSVAQTPVPPEFTDFNNSSLLDMLAAENSSNSIQNIKLENDFMPSLLDPNNTSSLGMNDILPNYNPISRSVPSTPLPIIGYGQTSSSSSMTAKQQQKQQYDIISKSVPTTPITNSTPFRYSPETNRDFLINGNSMDPSKVSSFYQANNQSTANSIDKELGIDDEIADLSSFDEVGVTDSIIESDLLNSL